MDPKCCDNSRDTRSPLTPDIFVTRKVECFVQLFSNDHCERKACERRCRCSLWEVFVGKEQNLCPFHGSSLGFFFVV